MDFTDQHRPTIDPHCDGLKPLLDICSPPPGMILPHGQRKQVYAINEAMVQS